MDPLKIVVPEPFAVRLALPARDALIVATPLLLKSKLVAFNVPEVIVPPVKRREPTVFVRPLRLRVPPPTLRDPVLAPRALALLATSVPEFT